MALEPRAMRTKSLKLLPQAVKIITMVCAAPRNTLIISAANRYCLYKREENSRDQTRRSKRSRGLNKNSKWARCYFPGATNLVILLVRVVYLTADKFSVMLL